MHGTDARGARWSASANRPLLVIGARAETPPDRYAQTARRLSPDVDVVVLAPSGTDARPYSPATVVSLDPKLAANALAAPTSASATPGDPLGNHLGDGWPTIIDGTGTPRAVLSVPLGIQPATLARCVQGILAEP